MTIDVRPILKEDIPELKAVLDSIELFPSEYLDEMTSDYINNPKSQDIWMTATLENKPIALMYCAPEKMTEGTFNLYAIGVKQNIQSKGVGQKMMRYLEKHLIRNGGRILIVDTSSTDSFLRTRDFYLQMGYSKEAVIRDFWSEGDDKVTFCKKLS